MAISEDEGALSGKTAVVTGGNSGIGYAIAELLMARGAEVYVLDLAVDSLPAGAHGVVCDLSRAAAVTEAFTAVPARLDILVNNAGIAHVGNAETTTEADMDALFAVNVKGVHHCLREALPRMKAHGGSIVNVASVASLVGIADRFAYSMTKGAVLTMTYSVAKDYVGYGIRCNAVAPARVHTPFVDGFVAKHFPDRQAETFARLAATQPIGRMGTPADVAHVVAFLCDDAAAFVTGACYPVDGGFVTLNS